MKAISYRFGLIKSIEFFLKFLILNLLISTIFSGLFHVFKFSEYHPLVNTISSIISIVISIKTSIELKNWNIYDELNFSSESKLLLIPMIFVVAGTSILLLEIRNYLFFYFPMSVFFKKIFMQVSGTNISVFWAVASILVFAPIVSEVLFRGIILNGLKNKYYVYLSIIFSSFLFAAITFNIYDAVPAFILGLILGTIYIKTHSLGLSIVLHMFSNLIVIIYLYLLELDISIYTNGEFHSIWLNSFAILTISIGLYMYYLRLRKLQNSSKKIWA